MKKTALLLSGLSALLFTSFLLADAKLDESEIQIKVNITFTNYMGPVTHVDRVEDIFGIGVALATNRKHVTGPVTTYGEGLYNMTRVISTNSDKLSADILSLGEKAGVNHIMTLKRIIAGYVGTAFAYERKNALVIANYIAYYNAYIRGNNTILPEKYSPEVGAAVHPEKMGLSANYKNWPGQTEMLLPLQVSDLYGKKVGANELYKTVDDKLQQKPDKGINERQDMLDVRKQQYEEKKTVLDNNIEDNKSKLERVNADIHDISRQEPSVKRDESLTNAQVKKNELLTDKSTLANERDKLLVEKKDIQQDEKKLAQDVKEVNYSGQETALYVYYLKIIDAAKNSKELDIIEKAKMQISRSKTGMAGQNFGIYKSSIIVASLNPSTSTYSLTSFTGDTLDIVAQGKEPIHPLSPIVVDSSQVFAVIIDKSGQTKLGKFGADKLDFLGSSEITVSPAASIVVTKDSIFITTLTGKITVLNKDDLKTVKILDQPAN